MHCLIKIAASFVLCLMFSLPVNADKTDVLEKPTLMRVTCYTWTGNPTASGCYPYEGIVAGKREWLGCVAIIYDVDMNYIGTFEFRDTGAGMDTDGDGIGDSIRNGTSIDVYRDTLAGCYDWIGEYGDYCYVQIIETEG